MRKIIISTCLLAGALVSVTEAVADPLFAPFLSVDINGYNSGGGESVGPTQAGFQAFEAVQGVFLDPFFDWGNSGPAGLTRVFATPEGNVTANLRGVAPDSIRGARNRGGNGDALGGMTQDFVFAQRNVNGLGRHFIKLTLSGLIPNQTYEATAYAREPFNGGADSFQAWTDLAALGGVDGPGAYMDANIAPNALYQPAPDGANNPIPTLARAPISGPNSDDPYAYSASLLTTANGAGIVTLYGWADPNTFTGTQSHSLLNGFELGLAPEPSLLGDYNGNDIIDAADYTVWRDALTAGSMTLPNDPTPGTVDESDFEYWRNHFGDVPGSGAGSAAVIPEPSTLLLFCIGVLGVVRLRRRHGSH